MKQQIIQLCKTGLAGVMLLCLTGCYWQAAKNLERSRQLRVGMTKAEVLNIMGDPVKEEFSTPDRWYYFVDSVWGDGLTTEEECMPLIFEKGKLTGWGNKYYAAWRASKELKNQKDDVKKKEALTGAPSKADSKKSGNKKVKTSVPGASQPQAVSPVSTPGTKPAVDAKKTEEKKK